MSNKHPHISKISIMHYAKLVGRSCLFLMAGYFYFTAWRHTDGAPFDGNEFKNWYLLFI